MSGSATPSPPPRGCIWKPKTAMDGDCPTLFVPSVGRSPGNLWRKINVFSGVTEQFGQTRARERLIWSGRREPWPHPTGAVQGDVTTWTAEQLLASQWSLWAALLHSHICFQPYRPRQVTPGQETITHGLGVWPTLGRGKTGANWRLRAATGRCSSAPAQFLEKTCTQATRIPYFKAAARNPGFFFSFSFLSMGNLMPF